MRAFAAIEITKSVANKLTVVQRGLQEAIGGRDVRWVRPDAIHITLKFLGEISAEQASMLLQEFVRVAESAEPFTLAASGLGCFPHCRSPRLLWAGVEDDLSALEQLQNATERCSVQLGHTADRRRFSAHLTIGRIRSRLRPVEADVLREAVRAANGQRFAEWQVAEMVLMQSKLCSDGAQYTRWARIPFQHGPPITIG